MNAVAMSFIKYKQAKEQELLYSSPSCWQYYHDGFCVPGAHTWRLPSDPSCHAMAEGHVTCCHARGMLVAVAARGKWQSAMPRAGLPARTLQLRLARASSGMRAKLHAISHGAASYIMDIS